MDRFPVSSFIAELKMTQGNGPFVSSIANEDWRD